MPPSAYRDARAEIDAKAELVRRELTQHVLDRGKLAIVKAPPGSGKTYLLLQVVAAAYKAGLRVAIATQTNSQADDICNRLQRDYKRLPTIRFLSGGGTTQTSVTTARTTQELPTGKCVVVGTAAKWGLVTIHDPFDILVIEEAWQLAWADFMLLGQVSARFVLIGDPGQISPVVTIDTSRWETSPRAPHRSAPQTIIEERAIRKEMFALPATRRLPNESVDLIRPFYDFEFGVYAAPRERQVSIDGKPKTGLDRALSLLGSGPTAAVTLPTPDSGPPMDEDPEIADLAVEVVRRLLSRKATLVMGKEKRQLDARDIGVVATHRVMNAAIARRLPERLQAAVNVDTPERWQGLERPVMILVHPLSGVVQPSSFDLETGRLCVMASRHQAGLIVLARDHVPDTLGRYIPAASQPVGRPDVEGRGLHANLTFWKAMEDRSCIVGAS